MSAERPFSDAPEDFGLIETFLWSRAQNFWLRELHLARLAFSAQDLGFAFRRGEVDAVLDAFDADADFMRVRAVLSRNGALALTASPFAPENPAKIWRVAIAPDRVESSEKLLRHKTTRRDFYEKALAASGADEVIFLNERDELCEGARTNIFVPQADGLLLTPPLASGLLPGVLRAHFLAQGRAREKFLGPDELPQDFLIGNSLRGLLKARRI